MQAKKEAERKQIQNDRDFFCQVGKTATDKFYINEDKRKENSVTMKYGAK